LAEESQVDGVAMRVVTVDVLGIGFLQKARDVAPPMCEALIPA